MPFEIISTSFTVSPDAGARKLLVTFMDTTTVRDRIVETTTADDTITESGSQTDRVLDRNY